VGSHVAERLLEAGYRVRALNRGAAALPAGCESVTGDLHDVGAFARVIDGSRYLVHCAALYSLASRDREDIARVNVSGTASLLAAAHLAGVERAIVTSSSAAVGHARNGVPADESAWAETGVGAYHDSKLLQERASFASRVPVVAILPTAPIGPGDRKPTPTGKLLVDFARGKIFGKPPGNGGMNVVAVEDVARAHVVALERGRIGERYIVGGENMSFDRLWEMLSDVTGRAVPRLRVPAAVAYAFAYAGFAPVEGVRLSSEQMYVDSSKAIAELDHRPSDVRNALVRAVEWFRSNGHL